MAAMGYPEILYFFATKWQQMVEKDHFDKLCAFSM